MRRTLVGFLAAGLGGGLLAGLYDGLGAWQAEGGNGPLVAGAVGLHLAAGAALGAALALVAPLVPRTVGAIALGRQVLRRLWPGPDDALHERCQTVATLWLGLCLGAAGLVALARGAALLLARVQTPELAALSVTLLALVVFVLGLAVVAPLRAGLARALEWTVRRRPALTPLSHPLVALGVAAAGGLWAFQAWRAAEAETWGAVDMRPLVSATVLTAAVLLAGAALRLRLRALPGWLAPGLAGLALVGGVAGLSVGLAHPAARFGLAERTGSSRMLLALLRAPFDADGDGFSPVLGGRDCDDEDARVHPGAREAAGNGVDEDCDGQDLRPPELAPVPTPELPPADPEPTLAPPYNLVLVTIDSLRADHVGAYGYRRATTPNLDALATEATLFRNAYSPSAKTPTAVPALLAGRYPSELWRDDRHFAVHHARNVFFAEVLQARGWHTAGFPSHWYFNPGYGLGQGFDVWVPYTAPGARMERVPTAEPVVERALEHLRGALPAERGKPFLMWLHVLDPHKDYLDHPGIERFGTQPVDRYDHEVRYADHWLGELLGALRGRADWDRTAVVVTSDHGEAFGEHGYAFHGFGLHEHQLRVPLIIRVPGLEPSEVESRVSLMDLAPTLYDLAGIGQDPEVTALGLRGVSLLPALLGQPLPDRPVYAEMPRGPFNSARAALLVGRWKIHHNAEGDYHQLFDLLADPGEKSDRWQTDPSAAATLREALARFRAENLEVRPPGP